MPPWTVELDYKLLLAVISTNGGGPVKWEEVHKIMGDEFNRKGLQNRMDYLKRTSKGAETGATSGNQSSPKKQVDRAPPKTSKKRVKDVSEDIADSIEDPNATSAPTHVKKTKKVKSIQDNDAEA